MRPTSQDLEKPAAGTAHRLTPPALFKGFALLGTVGVVACVTASIVFAPASNPVFHFGEDGAITALSSVTLAMASALALMVFYLRMRDWSLGALFWLVLAGGCLFLALDEQLMFHERGGHVIEATSVGEAELFRNWNDLIVIAYGAFALAIAAVFGREVVKCRTFAAFFVLGFAFYAVHTGIDSLVPNTLAWKDIPEETAKLVCVFAMFLGICAQLLALTEKMLAGAREPRKSTVNKALELQLI
jgi:hypothetical protein